LLILLYQAFWDDRSGLDPDSHDVEITLDRSRWREADVVVFHLPQLSQSGFPPQKLPGQLWIAWCMESEVHCPALASRAELGPVFDLWMTYQRDADVWCPYLDPRMVDALRSPPRDKTETSIAAAFISSAYDRSQRAALLEGLMREMPVDSYGRLHRNRSLKKDSGRATKLATIARYKFTLAFENSICLDYVTEKFFDPLLAGSVPVYLGAPNVAEFAPGRDCYIDASLFETPRALAAYLLHLAGDDAAYARYFRWKSEPLQASFLALVETSRGDILERLTNHLREMTAQGRWQQRTLPPTPNKKGRPWGRPFAARWFAINARRGPWFRRRGPRHRCR
jgi:hypothetical protein